MKKDPNTPKMALIQKEPTLEQWTKLYKLAADIKKIAPWEHLWDVDLITIVPPGYQEPIFCSTMGRNGETYAIGLYLGYEGLASLYRVLEGADEPALISGFQQKCLICYFGDREEILPKDRAVMNELGIKFRGRNQWVYFRSFEPGFYPWHINAKEADCLIIAFENIIEVFHSLFVEGVKVDFENGMSFVRTYSQEDQKWVDSISEVPDRVVEVPFYEVKDELLVKRLKGEKKNKQHLEFDVLFIPVPIQDNKNTKPYLKRIVILADSSSGILLDQHLIEQKESVHDCVIGILTGYIQKFGRPSAIHARDFEQGGYIKDLCQKLDIRLIENVSVSAIDDIYESMMDYFGL